MAMVWLKLRFWLVFLCLTSSFLVWAHAADVQSFTILHTNDLHSRYRPENTPVGLGGYARLKTAIDRIRAAEPHTALVDGGDWSEGSVYYTLSAGVDAVRLMDQLGFDATVVGNHDWLNGPNTLLNVLNKAAPQMHILGANLNMDEFDRALELKKWVRPWVIKKLGNVRVAFIGLSTYEWIYDRYFAPVSITEPLQIAYDVSHTLKTNGLADVVVALSHNSVLANKAILKYAPDIDLIIGAHDHQRLTEPVEVSRWPWGRGSSWIVEAEAWGKFLGRVDMTFSASDGVSLAHYELIPMSRDVPEDPAILSAIERLEERLEEKYGPVFHEQVGHCDHEFSRSGPESDMGKLITDAYRTATGSDLALDSFRFTYGRLHQGPIMVADLMGLQPAVYDPVTQKRWTMKTVSMSGNTLWKMMALAYGSSQLSYYGFISASGLKMTYDPWFRYDDSNPFNLTRLISALAGLFIGPSVSGVQEIKVGEEPLDFDRMYKVAVSDGIIEGMNFVNTYLPGTVPYEDLQDSGIEAWQVVRGYIQAKKRIDQKLVGDTRIRTLKPDLTVSWSDVQWQPGKITEAGVQATVTVRILNRGAQRSKGPGWFRKGPVVRLLENHNGFNQGKTADYRDLAEPISIPALEPDEATEVSFQATIPAQGEYFPVTVQIEGTGLSPSSPADQTTRWFSFAKSSFELR